MREMAQQKTLVAGSLFLAFFGTQRFIAGLPVREKGWRWRLFWMFEGASMLVVPLWFIWSKFRG